MSEPRPIGDPSTYHEEAFEFVLRWLLRLIPVLMALRFAVYLRTGHLQMLGTVGLLGLMFGFFWWTRSQVRRGRVKLGIRAFLGFLLGVAGLFVMVNQTKTGLLTPPLHLFFNLTLFQLMAFLLEEPKYASRWGHAASLLYVLWTLVFVALKMVHQPASILAFIVVAPALYLFIETRLLHFIVCHLYRNIGEVQRKQEALLEANEALAMAKEEAQNASLAKSRFLASTSHELRTPLNAILGYAELAREDIEFGEMDSVGDDLERIQRAAKHLLHMIDAVLDLSAFEKGELVILPRPFALRPFLHQILDLIRPLAKHKHNRLVFEIDPRVNDELVADQSKVEQCLMQLLDNAAKYTVGGEIALRVRPEGKKHLLFEIADTGPGMTQEQQERIFHDFWQVSPTEEGQNKGAGLGLTVTRRVWEAMEGTIELQSEAGKGTTFHLKLPLLL